MHCGALQLTNHSPVLVDNDQSELRAEDVGHTCSSGKLNTLIICSKKNPGFTMREQLF